MLIECFVDGAAQGQGRVIEEGQPHTYGEASCAVVIYKNRKVVAHFARGLGKRDNNEAEYEAVITALLMCAMAGYSDPIIYSDSTVVVNQVNGDWECHSDKLKPLLLTIRVIQQEFNFRIMHVNRAVVSVADTAAHDFLDQLKDVSLLAPAPKKRKRTKRKRK